MVDKQQRPRSGPKYSLKSQAAAAIAALPPAGFTPLPPLIGLKTIPLAVRMLHAKNYAHAYKTISMTDWNAYVSFGIQQFDSPEKYYAQHRKVETSNERKLRIARYYRYHLENRAPVDRYLMKIIASVEIALNATNPGYFDMSTPEMDEYLSQLTPDTMDIAEETSQPPVEETSGTQPMDESLDTQPMDESEQPSLSCKKRTDNSPSPAGTSNLTQALDKVNPVSTPPSAEHAQSIPLVENPQQSLGPTSPPPLPATHPQKMKKPLTTPTQIPNVLRVEVRWAPKDFDSLRKSSALMFTRFAPIISRFNTVHSWVLEWQVDQAAPETAISPVQLSKYLSIRIVTSVQQQCFYFSFRIAATGAQFLQVAKSKALRAAKQGEKLSLDPSYIPSNQGETINVCDILLEDAASAHRINYLQYLRTEVLPSDTPAFDLQIRHKDPAGLKIQVLTVKCGRRVSTQVAKILSTSLDGSGTNPEIFISRLALGANREVRGDYEKIYQVHHDYMADIVRIPFLVSRQIDTPVVDYLDSGDQIQRSPRQWAKSLVYPDGTHLEADLENGTLGGGAVLITPSAAHEHAQQELQKYWQRQTLQ